MFYASSHVALRSADHDDPDFELDLEAPFVGLPQSVIDIAYQSNISK